MMTCQLKGVIDPSSSKFGRKDPTRIQAAGRMNTIPATTASAVRGTE